MKTTKELILDIQKEYIARREQGEKHYDIKDYYAFFYVKKHLSDEEKAKFSKEAILESLEYFKEKRNEIIEEHSEVQMLFFNNLEQEIYPFQILFQFCVPFASSVLTEDDIIAFLSYFDNTSSLKYFNDYQKKYFDVDISNSLLYLPYVLELIIYYQNYQPISNRIIKKLEQLKNHPKVKEVESKVKEIDDIINGNGTISDKFSQEEKPKEIFAQDLATGKKWKWLQDYDYKFIDKKEHFFALIEELSTIKYFTERKFPKKTVETLQLIKPDEYEIFVLDIYNAIIKEGNKRSSWFVGDKVVCFKIFVRLLHYFNTPNQYSILTKLAEKCFTKIPRVGPVSRKLGDTILTLLEESETIEGLGVLINLKARNKYPVFRDALKIAFKKAVNYSKLNPNEVEDYFINDYGLINGKVTIRFGEFRSEVEVENFSKVNIVWYKPDGSLQKSVPAKVKNDFSSELKIWKAKHKDIKKELSGQKQRLEGFWHKKKSWSFNNWKQYILEHELLGFLTKPIIWQFEIGEKKFSAMWNDGELINSNGTKITQFHDSNVSLWHPCNASLEEVQDWRNFILTNEIKQPFKQAYREIYLVTDAEVTTSTYSNRYLNHIIRHQKFVALAKQRLWEYASVFAVDYPNIEYSDYKIKATLDINGRHEYVTTERVHFRDISKNEAMPMEEIPPIIFSETMRDVDLFVGVCSIGAEEIWHGNLHRDYWSGYSKSKLSETAETRKSILKNIIPRLKIKDQCELTDKYLIIKGKVRTYKIHLGSGNILMEPNDQYLCIVPDRSKKSNSDKIFLPIDDDYIFSIILSKALLLADDDKITDQVILNQINR